MSWARSLTVAQMRLGRSLCNYFSSDTGKAVSPSPKTSDRSQ